MNANELRKRFLSFFEQRGHTVVPSSSLIPDDPSVLLTTAGMQQFKPYYTDELDSTAAVHPSVGEPVGTSAVSIQKSFRTSDIEEVGDESHLTFFEMLGNFSFGGYGKQEAIEYTYVFLVEELGLTIGYVTVFEGDDDVPFDAEAETVWQALGIDDIRRHGRDENWWGPTGNEGPCGPTTEVFIRDVEIWNIVFNEYYCHADGTLEPLERLGIDTGMGFERLVQTMHNAPTLFETELFAPLLKTLVDTLPQEKLTQDRAFDVLFRPGQALEQDISNALSRSKALHALRIIADHLRASIFLLADGVRPSNQERGYILRRLIRRFMRYARQLGMDSAFHQIGVDTVIKQYGEAYPELSDEHTSIAAVLEDEVEKFSAALQRGQRQFSSLRDTALAEGRDILSGEEAFDLYQSYGFPVEMTEEMAAEEGLTIDREAFEQAMEEHKQTSKAGQEKKFGGHGLMLDTGEIKAADDEEVVAAKKLHTATHLLHAALRVVLGEHVEQRGSDITAKRLRFDFSHSDAMTEKEIQEVEQIVNDIITKDFPVTKQEMPLEQATKSGALAFFRAKYPPIVSVYTVGNPDNPFSREICGGPHVKTAGEIGGITIVKEQSSGAGVRRIRAVLNR